MAVSKFKILSQHLHWGTEENREKPENSWFPGRDLNLGHNVCRSNAAFGNSVYGLLLLRTSIKLKPLAFFFIILYISIVDISVRNNHRWIIGITSASVLFRN
jgi:hypothetical protein